MFRALWRLMRAVGYALTGRVDKAREALQTDPNVIRATFDDVLREKKKRIDQFMEAVAGLRNEQEKKKRDTLRLDEDITKLKNVSAGALAAAKKRAAALQAQGKSQAEIMADSEFKKHQAAHQDFTTTLAEKQVRREQLDRDIKG